MKTHKRAPASLRGRGALLPAAPLFLSAKKEIYGKMAKTLDGDGDIR